ncbi:hypothetical protein [Thalassobius sp. Cn5-15]|uniref:hypothetical protein n=1 Tax=Thalassobius sp. Cn5-15 TaxID=2917763 RepID=UPI001EF3B868|nr:hypothetical protein [Thalassobius sp. Cn5-15]MCG7493408.1 hypothetical protein [Thalassobius sp. Cn5-15]
MADKRSSSATPMGLYNKPSQSRITGFELAAAGLSVVWMAGASWFFLSLPRPDASATANAGPDGLRFLMTLLVIFLPVAMIWVGATAARSSRVMREESARLQSAIDAIRQAYVAQSAQTNGQPQGGETVARKLDEIAAAQRKTETALATFTSSRDRDALRPAATEPAGDSDDQAALPFGTPADELHPPLARNTFIRALNFPDTAEDEEGFAALRQALKDREAALLIEASQNVLTLLSQDGIYMDDLRPDLCKPEIWRRFALGERGRTVAKIGGIHDRSSLALTAGRMKQDPTFRDAAHNFLRRFDRMIQSFEKVASDTEITTLSETRTARAFMLLGRVAGIFD